MTIDGTTIEHPGIERLGVDLGERSYDILIGAGLLADAGRLIAPVLRAGRVAVITDRNVADAGHLATLETALAGADITSRTIILEPGEQTKDFAHLEQVPNMRLNIKAFHQVGSQIQGSWKIAEKIEYGRVGGVRVVRTH